MYLVTVILKIYRERWLTSQEGFCKTNFDVIYIRTLNVWCPNYDFLFSDTRLRA